MPTVIGQFTSQKFKFWVFASMIMLLFVHSYNLNERYLRPFSIVREQLTFDSFLQYFLSNGLFRFFIPILFSISGYLYATQDARSLCTENKKTISQHIYTLPDLECRRTCTHICN